MRATATAVMEEEGEQGRGGSLGFYFLMFLFDFGFLNPLDTFVIPKYPREHGKIQGEKKSSTISVLTAENVIVISDGFRWSYSKFKFLFHLMCFM